MKIKWRRKEWNSNKRGSWNGKRGGGGLIKRRSQIRLYNGLIGWKKSVEIKKRRSRRRVEMLSASIFYMKNEIL
jgi:hypothetical protein